MMNWISRNNILIVGLGLMGGSYAKALKRLGFKVEAIDSRPESTGAMTIRTRRRSARRM